MSKAGEVLRSGDEMIRELGVREGSGIVDYAIGRKVSVSYRGGGKYLCHTCKYPENYQRHDHKGCAHIQRIQRFREERQEVLNDIKADPALEVPLAS